MYALQNSHAIQITKFSSRTPLKFINHNLTFPQKQNKIETEVNQTFYAVIMAISINSQIYSRFPVIYMNAFV